MTTQFTTLRKLARRLLGRGNSAEIQQRRRSVSTRKTDYRRWTDANSYNPQWSTRSDLALELLGQAQWICDLGCGPQDLRKMLPADSIYLPMDLKQWTDDTIVCDINNKILPSEYLELCDVCFVMGVLEYIYDPTWFLNELASRAEGIIISYNVAELCRVKREDNGWVNNLTTEQFRGLVEAAGFKIEDTRLYDNAQLIIKGINPAFAAQSARQTKRAQFANARSATAQTQ